MTEKTFLQRVAEKQAAHQPAAAPAPPAPPAVSSTTCSGDNAPWVSAAYASEIADLANTPKGKSGLPGEGRNHALNVTALKLGRLPINRAELRRALEDACHRNGLMSDPDDGPRSVDATINSAFAKADLDGPRDIPAPRTNVTEVNAGQIAGPAGSPTVDGVWGTHQPIQAHTFLFAHDDNTVALWGENDDILWAEGEALMIAGGMGLGKTTLAGQIIRAQLGLDTQVLGLPVEPVDGTILYLAMDRPRQIRRSMRRQFDHTDSQQLEKHLLIRTGPPIADLAARPTLLLEMAQACNATVVYLDSLKDAAIGLSNDEVGGAYNRARQYLLADNRQICELHHNRKLTPGAPGGVTEIYGSTWLTSGAGSVVMLTGEPGDPIIEFRHVKQPLNEVGPWRLLHNSDIGQMSVDHQVDLLELCAAAGANGLTAQCAAAALFEREKPTRAQTEKARYRLDRLVAATLLQRVEGTKGGAAGGRPTTWFLADERSDK